MDVSMMDCAGHVEEDDLTVAYDRYMLERIAVETAFDNPLEGTYLHALAGLAEGGVGSFSPAFTLEGSQRAPAPTRAQLVHIENRMAIESRMASLKRTSAAVDSGDGPKRHCGPHGVGSLARGDGFAPSFAQFAQLHAVQMTTASYPGCGGRSMFG